MKMGRKSSPKGKRQPELLSRSEPINHPLVSSLLISFKNDNGQATLVSAITSLYTQTGFTVNAVPHDADIDQMGKRRHEGIHTAIHAMFVDDPSAYVGTRFGIEHGDEMVLLVKNRLIHELLPLRKLLLDAINNLVVSLFEKIAGFPSLESAKFSAFFHFVVM